MQSHMACIGYIVHSIMYMVCGIYIICHRHIMYMAMACVGYIETVVKTTSSKDSSKDMWHIHYMP